MPVWAIVVLIILAVLLVAFIALAIYANKLQKKSEDMRFLFPEIDDVLILCSFVGFRSSRHVDRFQNIRLTLRVISIENICAAAEINM